MFGLAIRRVVGDSMIPSYSENNLILVKKTKHFRVGQVVGFEYNDKVLLKRISEIKDSKYYLLGDNPNNSLDSRKLGWIDQDKIIFKVIFKL
jgi:phage repressor protein C with HTH and peptisase S24 domain